MADKLHLKVLLPHQVFLDEPSVSNLIIETPDGSYGLLPNRLDCVAALVCGILVYETVPPATQTATQTASGLCYVAIDEGIMTKFGENVLISVRSAFSGSNLGELEQLVEREFASLSDREKQVRAVISKLESEFVKRYVEASHE